MQARTRTPPPASKAAEKKKTKKMTDRAWKEAKALMWHHRASLAIGMALMLVNRLSGLVLPASSKYLIDRVIGHHDGSKLVPLALAVGGATLVQALTSFSLSQVISVAAQRAITDMRRRVQARVTRLPVRFFDSTQTGVLISRIMTDAEGIRNLVGTGIVQLVGGLVTSVLALGVLLWLNWKLTAFIFVFLAIFGGVMAVAFNRLRPIFRERGELNAEVTGRLTETLGGIRVIKAYGTEKREQRVFTKGANRMFRNVASTITGTSAVTAFATLVIGAVGVLMIVVGGRAIMSGEMTLGGLVMYIFFTGMLAAPVVQLASIGTQISEAFAGLDRIRDLLDTKTEDDEDDEAAPLDTVRGDVRFEDVSFEYEPGVPVLKHVVFDAPAGTTTALVGSSGSGKSTLVSLVMAFNRPVEGRITVDGQDLAGVKLHDYRKQLGVVLQDNFLFDGTVADNIRFSRPDATRAEIVEVSRIAHADDFIRGFPDGYDAIVGERGIKLSGGQRQRIAIARAILADPRILILDEATSSLDSESEALIQEGLRRLREGRTTFVIAHRLSTIRSADQILVLEAGEIVERGTHAQLMALGGRYRELHDRQYAWEQERYVNPGEELPVETGAPAEILSGD
ncbi:MAG TPA: ABC transporter ATP-binding protein [Longimicrobiaceae bacterium]|nr:ABC transporter ATP-binding protein [Longimicrobiaceae bacterium]